MLLISNIASPRQAKKQDWVANVRVFILEKYCPLFRHLDFDNITAGDI